MSDDLIPITRSRRSLAISHRRAFQLIVDFVNVWVSDCVGSLGAIPGIGNVYPQDCRIDPTERGSTWEKHPHGMTVFDDGNQKYHDPTSDDPTALPSDWFGIKGAVQEIKLVLVSTDSKAMGRSHLMSLDNADFVLRSTATKCATSLFHHVMLLMNKSPTKFRKWAAYRRALRRLAQLEVVWKQKLLLATYPQVKKEKGFQRVSIRNARKRKKPIPDSGRFTFNGRSAIRFPRGRAPLTEAEWLKRYKARQKRAKHPRPNREPVTVPPLASGRARPLIPIIRPKTHDTVTRRNLWVGNAASGLDAGNYWDDIELDPVMLAGTFPEINAGQV